MHDGGAHHGAHDPIALFETISEPGELGAVLAVRAFTDTWSRDMLARLERIDPSDRLAGPGSTDATTPFLFYPPHGSRFTSSAFFFCDPDGIVPNDRSDVTEPSKCGARRATLAG